jgi:hypothetical protein
MARTNKIGIDYFPFDVDFFNDEKIEFTSARFGIKGEIIAIRLLCKIYRNGYFTEWNEDESTLLAKRAGDGMTPSLVSEIVNELIKRGFFNKSLLDRFKILTSKGIQTRYFEATKRYKQVDVIRDFLLVDVSKMENVSINKINVNINPNDDDTNPQKKRKESKRNNIIPPLPPNGGDVVSEKSWRDDFEVYLTDLRNAYKEIVIDTAYITERAKYHPGLNIKLSLEKACKDFWATEAGWKHKKKSKSNELNWKSTFTKALDIKSNQVWLQKGGKNEEQAIKYRKL